ncbi:MULTISPECIES: FimV/HubP family polar landmark protein [unclassified Stenotrophomonas]|uniref:FimV/HubP family polar landmark protein n=1 Tax=unclassified Stenotrophomonas TaxID=196198 RepID=UPI002118FB1A|nr:MULTISPECIES: FimV/HubP family polar landmark protein [unclassified Stenotrophomonas]
MNNRAPGALRPLKYVSTLLLALASSSAMALGLGDIRVLSKPGQPLLAEIPVISADPAELQNLRVALASPVTFARVGLERPAGLVSELQFELTQNAQGRAVVRVSTQAPVTTPSLNFLIEADWGQGRLVREYSALVDAPNSALAVAEPEIVAPAGAMSNAIVREPDPVPTAEPATPVAAAPTPSRAVPVPPRNSAPRAPAPAPAPAPASVAADGSITVQRGQTLSQIADSVARGQGINRNQAMIALLRANPDAFIRGNVNLLKQGAVLRSPAGDNAAPIDANEAAAIVREHAAQWRQSRAAIPQPASSGVAASPGPATAPAAAGGARLEIAPAVAATDNNAGTTTGTAAGSEGDMLGNEQLRQAKEDVATRDAEIQELRGRVAELEKLEKQQQSLIAMKDSDLAAAQQRLGQAPAAREAGGAGWYWLGLAVLLLVVAGWAVARRRKPSPLPPLRRDGLDATALAAAVPATDYVDELAAQQEPHDADPVEDVTEDYATPPGYVLDGGRREPVFSLEPEPGYRAAAVDTVDGVDRDITVVDDVITDPDPRSYAAADLDSPVDPTPVHALEAAAQPAFRGVFEFPDDGNAAADARVDTHPDTDTDTAHDALAPFDVGTGSDLDSSHGVPAAGRDRLELAIAYLDLGDAETARTLLQDVVAAADPHSQAQARELLARLG